MLNNNISDTACDSDKYQLVLLDDITRTWFNSLTVRANIHKRIRNICSHLSGIFVN